MEQFKLLTKPSKQTIHITDVKQKVKKKTFHTKQLAVFYKIN